MPFVCQSRKVNVPLVPNNPATKYMVAELGGKYRIASIVASVNQYCFPIQSEPAMQEIVRTIPSIPIAKLCHSEVFDSQKVVMKDHILKIMTMATIPD